MLLVSTSANLRIQLRPEKSVFAENGEVIRVDRRLVLEFRHGGLIPDFAWDVARQMPDYGRGAGIGQDPRLKCGWFDTDAMVASGAWTEEERGAAEDLIRARPELGSMFAIAEKPRLEPPWPKYDSVRGKQGKPIAAVISEMVADLGLDPANVLAYELENKARGPVIEALEELAGLAGPAEREEIVEVNA